MVIACILDELAQKVGGWWWTCFGVVWIESPLFTPGTNWLIGELDGLTVSWAGCWWYDMLDYFVGIAWAWIEMQSFLLGNVALDQRVTLLNWAADWLLQLRTTLMQFVAIVLCLRHQVVDFDYSNVARDTLLDWSWALADKNGTSRLRLRVCG